MRVTATTDAPPATDADTIAVGVFEDEGIAHDHGGVLQALVDSGEAKRGLRKLAVTHAEGSATSSPGSARAPTSIPSGRASPPRRSSAARRSWGPKTLCWEVPHHVTDAHVGALVEGTLLASYAYREFKAADERRRARGAGALRPPRRERGRRRTPRPWRRRSTPRATCRTGRRTCSRRPRWPSARRRSTGVTVEVLDRRRHRGRRAWARSPAVARGSDEDAAADHDPLRAAGRHRAAARASSARR